jgi:hypothetical protein
MTSPSDVRCHICQRSPARMLTIRRHVGMIFMQRFVKMRMPLCQQHGTKLTLDFLGKTLWQGWWGYISFFVNIFVVLSDLVVLVLARRLGPPVGSSYAAPQPAAATWVPASADGELFAPPPG